MIDVAEGGGVTVRVGVRVIVTTGNMVRIGVAVGVGTNAIGCPSVGITVGCATVGAIVGTTCEAVTTGAEGPSLTGVEADPPVDGGSEGESARAVANVVAAGDDGDTNTPVGSTLNRWAVGDASGVPGASSA